MSGLVPPGVLAGAAMGVWPVAFVLLAAAAWGLHVWRLRARERELLALVAEHNRRSEEPCGAASPDRSAAFAAAPAPIGRARVLLVTSPMAWSEIGTRLAGLDLDFDRADSAWSAAAACQEAYGDGRPYNLVLLDTSLPGSGEPDWPERLQAELEPWGARVAAMRAGATKKGRRRADCGEREAVHVGGREGNGLPGKGTREEGTGPHENPDRRRRTGFAPAAAADAAALGVRSRRGE